jgi:hypothetical protein
MIEFSQNDWVRPVKDRLEPKRSDRQVFEEMFLIESENLKSRNNRNPEGKNEPERIIWKDLINEQIYEILTKLNNQNEKENCMYNLSWDQVVCSLEIE